MLRRHRWAGGERKAAGGLQASCGPLSPFRPAPLQGLRACLAAAAVRLPEALQAAAHALQASCRPRAAAENPRRPSLPACALLHHEWHEPLQCLLDAALVQSGVLPQTPAHGRRDCNPPAGCMPSAADWTPPLCIADSLLTPAPPPPSAGPLQKRGCMTHHRLWTAPELGAVDPRLHAPAAALHMGAAVQPHLPGQPTHLARSPLPVSLPTDGWQPLIREGQSLDAGSGICDNQVPN